MSDEDLDQVLLTKQAVAIRLINSAVSMIEAGIDPLAIHAIAASASNLLRELVAVRGPNYGSRVFASALFEQAIARVENRLAVADLPDDPEVEKAVQQIEDAIRNGQVSSPDDVVINMSGKIEAKAMRHISAPFNFMKHGDRDPDGLLNERELRPREALMHAISAFSFLFPNEPLEEATHAFVSSVLNETNIDNPS
ncbi:MAG: hypothetical protein H6918_12600 [Sphingomonadaceae bacterium]|nr:hypothetical protein [Sphingomonadaceae bacterium]